jgi:tetratricopeptide (TPR) repeat protein
MTAGRRTTNRLAGKKRPAVFRFFAGCLIMFALFPASGCERSVSEPDDLAAAQEAASRQDWAQAARLLPRYLREENEGENRWTAWSLLVTAVENMKETAWAIEHLETMLQEYSGNERLTGAILRRLGDNYAEARLWDQASVAWLRLLDIEDLPPDETAVLYHRMGFFHFLNRDLPAAEDMFEMCVDSASDPELYTECRFWLADVLADGNRLDASLEKIHELLGQTNLSPGIAGQAYFLQGDIFQQQNRPEEAIQAFEKALPLHANPSAVQSRIDYLRKKP